MNPSPILSATWIGRAAAALVVLVGLGAPPATAQNTDIQDLRRQISALESKLAAMRKELRDLESRVGRRRITGKVPSTAAAQIDLRLNEFERSLRTLTGKIENLAHALRKVNANAKKFRADVTFRLDRLEKGAAGDPAKGAKTPAKKDIAAARTGPLPAGTPAQQYGYAKGLLRKGEFDKAARALRAFIKAYPKGPLTGDAYYWLGETYYVRGRYREAAVQFADGYQKFSKHPKAPDNILKLGMSLARLNKKAEACATLAELRRRYPRAGRYVKQTTAIERRRLRCG